MGTFGHRLIIGTNSSRLFSVDASSGTCDQLDGTWPDIAGVAATESHVGVVSQDGIYHVNPANGNYERV